MPNIVDDVKLDFKDVLLRPKRSKIRSRADVDLVREFKFHNSKQVHYGVPIIASNMDTVGTFDMAIALGQHKCYTCIHKYYSVDQWREFAASNKDILPYVAASSGIAEGDFERLGDICENVPDVRLICLDVANGYSQFFVEYVEKVRKAFPTHTILAGNVVTGEMTEALIFAGADIVKVGIGPGSVCTTRKKTGVGYPQLSAVMECADSAHGLGAHIISDGGCTCPGDVAKAIGAGADFVMLGGMLAGHDQSGGEVVENSQTGKKTKLFYGMSSATAMTKHKGGVAEYRASEGKTVEVPYRGCVNTTMLDILGGLRSACTYVGAGRVKEMPKRTTFIRVTQQLNEVFSNPN